MKKFFGLVAFLLLAGVSASHADLFKDAESDSGHIRYKFDNVTADTSTIIIDLSDNTNFPHSKTGYIVIERVRVDVDKVAASTATVRLGVLYQVSTTSGSVTWFYGKTFDRDTVGTHLVDSVNYYPYMIRAYATSSNTTPYILSTDKTTFSTTYQTDVGLPTSYQPTGAVFPAIGDIILYVDMVGTPSAMDIDVEIDYSSRR